MDRKDVEVMTCCCKGNEDGNVKHKQRDGGGRPLLRGYSHTGVSDPGGLEWV